MNKKEKLEKYEWEIFKNQFLCGREILAGTKQISHYFPWWNCIMKDMRGMVTLMD